MVQMRQCEVRAADRGTGDASERPERDVLQSAISSRFRTIMLNRFPGVIHFMGKQPVEGAEIGARLGWMTAPQHLPSQPPTDLRASAVPASGSGESRATIPAGARCPSAPAHSQERMPQLQLPPQLCLKCPAARRNVYPLPAELQSSRHGRWRIHADMDVNCAVQRRQRTACRSFLVGIPERRASGTVQGCGEMPRPWSPADQTRPA